MKKSTKIGIGLGILTTLGAIGFYFYKQSVYAKYLCYSFSNVNVKEASLSKVTIGLDYKIKNLDKLNIDITSLKINVYVEGKFATRIEKTSRIKIMPFETTIIPMNITFSPQDLASNLSSVLLGGGYNNLSIQFKGKIKVKKLGISFNIPYNKTYTIKELTQGDGISPC
tara:strand:+ start:183 stop:689 length:507 start_codon:yes stop_codon:yes gene_type:complete